MSGLLDSISADAVYTSTGSMGCRNQRLVSIPGLRRSSGAQCSLQVGCVGAGALAAFLAVRWLQSPGRVAEVAAAHEAAFLPGGAGRPGTGADAVGPDAELLRSADASTSPSNTWAAVGHLGEPVSTMTSAAMLSTAEILQSVATQQADAQHASQGCLPGSVAGSRHEVPGVAARSGDTCFSAALPSGLGSAEFLGAASVKERSAWGPLAALFRLSSGAPWPSHF